MKSHGSGRKLFVSFNHFLKQITKDAMLFLASVAPFLCGLFIRYGIPYANYLLTLNFNYTELENYYLLFDLFLALMAPMMFCFVSAMVILGEIDDGISKYLAVTPIGKSGYLVSRLVFPMGISFLVTIIILYVFSLSLISLNMIIYISALSSVIGLIISFMIISISTNKVEGLAVTKLTGISMIGIPAAFFLPEKVQYLLFFLPSLWLSKFVMEIEALYFILCIFISLIWIMILFKRFIRKII